MMCYDSSIPFKLHLNIAMKQKQQRNSVPSKFVIAAKLMSSHFLHVNLVLASFTYQNGQDNQFKTNILLLTLTTST